MSATTLTFGPYIRSARHDLLDLIQDQYRLHIHLDWATIDEWIEDPETLLQLAWDGPRMVGAMAAAPPLDGSSWLRLVVVHDDYEPDLLIDRLWQPICESLQAKRTREIGLLLLRPWLGPYAGQLGFQGREDVVTLARMGGPIPQPLRSDVVVWHGDVRDLDAVAMIDHAAFPPLWRLPKGSLRQAIRQAGSFTLALLNKEPVGYQISMRHQDGAHLARLATLPAVQGTGIGGVLLQEVLTGFARRGIAYFTVNTQETNRASQSLYERFGFVRTGVDMPVWTMQF